MDRTLTARDRSDLDQLEASITRGLGTFREVGNALLEIRDRRLYREAHGTWEAYCLDRWGLTRRHAYRLLEAARACDAVCPAGTQSPEPSSERVARPLTGLPPGRQREVWAQATAESDRPTAARVEQLAAKARAGLPLDEPAPPTPARQALEDVQRAEARVRSRAERDARREAVAAVARAVRKALALSRGLDAGEQEECERHASAWMGYLDSLG